MSATETVTQKEIDHVALATKYFDLPDADIRLECSKTLQTANDHVSGTTDASNATGHAESVFPVASVHTFRVHTRILAAHSTFFQAMIDTSETQDSGSIGLDLPKVRMEEDLAVVNILLGAAYNNSEVQAIFTQSKDWQFILTVWEAANKYGFQLLRALATTLLLLHASTVDDDGALKLYTRASVFDDQMLAGHFLERAALKPPHKLPLEVLRQIPATSLHHLLLRHKEHADAVLEDIFKAISKSSSGYTDSENLRRPVRQLREKHFP